LRLVDYWAQRTISPVDGCAGWTVVDGTYVEHPRAAEYLRVLLDAQDRSIGTARTYAGRLALYLTWAAGRGVDETRPSIEDLAAFARWLERTPSRKHRSGRNRRVAPGLTTVSLTPTRSPGTIDGILTVVVEFVRFLASRGWTDTVVADKLSARHELRFLPSGFAPLEGGGRPVIERRLVRRRRVQRPPMMLTSEQVGELVDECRNPRDRFVVEALYATGLRVAELCGLRRSDLHLVPSATHLGCRAAGPHLHVVRREDNENGALAKSIYPRVLPVGRALVWCHSAYCIERDQVPEAAESDYVLVNLYRRPLGRALSPAAVEELFVRLSARVGFRARPHMLRHSFASEVALATKDPALVKELLGHASIYSTDVYLHARWADMRAAVDAHAKSREGAP
jgi:site-specific recombinase XerD